MGKRVEVLKPCKNSARTSRSNIFVASKSTKLFDSDFWTISVPDYHVGQDEHRGIRKHIMLRATKPSLRQDLWHLNPIQSGAVLTSISKVSVISIKNFML